MKIIAKNTSYEYPTLYFNWTYLYNERGERRQIVEKVAETISSNFIPEAWRSANIVNICPVANEYRTDIVRMFAKALIGICPPVEDRNTTGKFPLLSEVRNFLFPSPEGNISS